MKTLAIVPVKVNSQRLPEKNLKTIQGKPLFMYAVNTLSQCNTPDKIVVCSEDNRAKEILDKNNFEEMVYYRNDNPDSRIEFLLRPDYLSRDPNQIADVCLWVIEQLKEEYHNLIMIQPSNPFITSQDITNCISLYLQYERKFQIRSVSKIEKNVWGKEQYSNAIHPLEKSEYYISNGGIVIENISSFLKKRDLITDEVIPYVMPCERSIDIDTQFDFDIAEMLMRKE